MLIKEILLILLCSLQHTQRRLIPLPFPRALNTMEQAGGMYNILKLAIDLTQQVSNVEFTSKDLSEQTGICQDTISKNLSRLVKLGILTKEEFWTENIAKNENMKARGKCRQVKYKINLEEIDVVRFIRDNLY